MTSYYNLIGIVNIVILFDLQLFKGNPVEKKVWMNSAEEYKDVNLSGILSDLKSAITQVQFQEKYGINLTTAQFQELIKEPRHKKPIVCNGSSSCTEKCDTGAGWSLTSDGINCAKCDENFSFVVDPVENDICVLNDLLMDSCEYPVDCCNIYSDGTCDVSRNKKVECYDYYNPKNVYYHCKRCTCNYYQLKCEYDGSTMCRYNGIRT